MAHLLGTQNVGALAGSRKLLEGVTVGLDDGSRVGILGPLEGSVTEDVPHCGSSL